MNGHFYFEIQADDTHRASGFYKGVFDWKFEQVYGLPVEYWRIENRWNKRRSTQTSRAAPTTPVRDKCVCGFDRG